MSHESRENEAVSGLPVPGKAGLAPSGFIEVNRNQRHERKGPNGHGRGILDAGQDAKTEILIDGLCLRGDTLRCYSIFRACSLFLVLGVAVVRPPEIKATTLRKATEDGFTHYVQATEMRIDKELARPRAFLYIDGLPQFRRSEALSALKRGEVYMERLATLDASGHPLTTPDGLIHHWMGAVFIPGATMAQVLAIAQDYNHIQDFYKPEVVRSHLVSRSGNDFKVFYRLRKKKIITVTLNTEHDVHYFPLSSTRVYSRSYSTRIAQVENADQPMEREKPVGQDGGFMWRLTNYWRFDARDGGVYVEFESITLTRDIPTGLGWLIKPFITGIPKESLQMSMGSIRVAVLARMANAPKSQ